MKITHFPDTIMSSILFHGVLRGKKLIHNMEGSSIKENKPPVPAPAADDCGANIITSSTAPPTIASTGWLSARR